MDFRFSDEQGSLRDLAREILAKEITPERLKASEARGDFFEREAWGRLAEANLLGLAIPEALGGMGMGFLELCLLLHELGRAVAPIPAFATLVLGALPLARFGSSAQQQTWLPGVARGEVVLSGACDEERPLEASTDGDTCIVSGARRNVPAAGLAQRIVLPVRLDGAERLLLLDPAAPGVAVQTSLDSRREPVGALALRDAHIPLDQTFGAPGCHAWLRERALAAVAATQLGVSERALEITTGYLAQREQFGAPLGALPTVQHRCADAYIALDALRWVCWLAVTRLAEEKPAAREAWVAKFWAAEAGSQIGTATQHLHGGMGVDMDYPIHRYFLWAKALELAFGSATPTLLALGDDMARTGPPQEHA